MSVVHYNNNKNSSDKYKPALMLIVFGMLSACGGIKDGPPPAVSYRWNEIPDAVPEPVTPSKYGNPESYEVFGKHYRVLANAEGFAEKGIASWYGSKFHGRRTSSGEIYDMHAMTAAHKHLPIPSYVEVTNLDNKRKAIVRVNDRGPFHQGRIIDLSYAAATKLDVAATGVANVSIRVVTPETLANGPTSGSSYSAGNGKVYVQLAAFTTEESALNMINDLRKKNFTGARIHVEQKHGKPLYRVRIGPVPTRLVAQELLAQLKPHHGLAKIVTYN